MARPFAMAGTAAAAATPRRPATTRAGSWGADRHATPATGATPASRRGTAGQGRSRGWGGVRRRDRSRAVVREAIADAVHRQQVARRPRLRLELAANVLDVGVDRPLVRLEGDAVDRVEELGPGEDPAGLRRERRQQLELRGGEIDRTTGDVDPHPRQVERDVAGTDDVV